METGVRPTYAEINLEALRHNFRLIREAAGSGTELLAVVKADAYGHGAVAASRLFAAEGAPLLAVALVEEALELRRAGIDLPILVMGGVRPGAENLFVEHNLTPYLFDLSTARRFAQTFAAAGRECRYHLKVDTGMGRIGVPLAELDSALQELAQLDSMRMAGLMTHFALADEPDSPVTGRQVECFRQALAAVRAAGFNPQYIHAANSAGIFTRELPECNLARPGIALYGGWPSQHFEHLDLRPVMSLRTRIAQLKIVPPGSGVSYGHRFVADRETRVATLPVGYADGYNRLLTGRGEALVRGQRVPVIGTVCMDWIMLDVTDVADAVVDDEVTLLGSDRQGHVIRAEEWADKVGTINYEVFCGISKRVPRIYVGR